ncbi:MAG: O-antigen ligase family protein [Candidatus Omnitrophota bacterium]
MIYKIIQFLKFLLLLNFSVFLSIAPYSKILVKIVLCVGLFLGMLLIIARFIKIRIEKKEKHPLRVFLAGFLPRSSLTKTALFFLFVSLCSVISSTDFFHSQSVFFERYIPYLFFFMFGYFLAKSRRNAGILLFVFMINVAVLGWGAGVDHFRSPAARIFSSFGRPVNLSNYLVLAAPLSCVVFLFAKNPILKLCGFITAVLSFSSLIWNGSRAAWLAVPISSLSHCFLKNRKAALILLVVLLIVVYFLAPAYKNRAMTMFDVSSWNRVELYRTAVRVFKAYPFFGSGLGTYEKVMYAKRFMPMNGYSFGREHLHAHNTYLEMLSEMGIIGLTAFLWIFFLFFRKVFSNKSLWKNERNDKNVLLFGLSSSIMAILIFALASTNITVGIQDSAVFWFLFGIASSFLTPPKPVQFLVTTNC